MNSLLVLLTLFLSSVVSSSAFAVAPSVVGRVSSSQRRSAPVASSSSRTSSTSSSTSQLSMIFGPKDDGSPGDYVCKDCGYVFTKGPQAWAALPADYSCPPCGAAKWRFTKVPKGSASGKVTVKGKAGGAQQPPKKKGLFG